MPHLQLLRAPSLTLANGSLYALERKDAALLAVLTTEGPCAPAQAAALLWQDAGSAQARANLRQRLYRLRKLAGEDVIVSANGRLSLADGTTVDIKGFDEALAADPHASAGDLLGSMDYGESDELQAWVDAARERWRKHRSERLAACASAREATGEIAAALVLAQRLIADDPLHEHNHRRLMRLHYLRGDRAAALAAYQSCRRTLQAQLGTTPAHETAAMATVIESSGVLPHPTQAPPPPLLTTVRPPRLCGRDVQWRLLEARCARGTTLLVEGEAGIGKTRLLGDFAAAHGNAPVFSGRPGDTALPYALLSRIVRGLAAKFSTPQADWVMAELARIAPSLGPAAAGQLSALRLQQAMAQALMAWSTGGLRLLVVDDLHHADPATLELLPALASGGDERGLTWLFGSRQAEIPTAIQAWLDAAEPQVAERVLLGPLDLAGVHLLLESLALRHLDVETWARLLLRHTGGNPLFLLETLIASMRAQAHGKVLELPDGVTGLPAPERIGRLIERRLQLLSPSAIKLARLAAIAGQDFGVALAVQVLKLDALDIADSWRELETAQVIRDDAFAHDLILESTLQSIPAAIARQLHGDVAMCLQGAQASPARLAAHWVAAEEWELAGDAFLAASNAARAASRNVESAALDDEAVRCFTQAGHADKAFDARRDSIANALATRNAEQVLDLTHGLLLAARAPAQRLDALIARVRALAYTGKRLDAMPLADEAVTLADTLNDPWQKFDAACCGALCMSPGPRAAEAIRRLQAFRLQIEAANDAKRSHLYHTSLRNALREHYQLVAALAEGELALAAARQERDTLMEQIELANQSAIVLQLGWTARGQALAEQACRLIEQGAGPTGLAPASAHLHLALFNCQAGRLDLALRGLEQTWIDFGKSGGTLHHAVCETHMANLWLQLGQPARGLQAMAPVPEAFILQLPASYARRLMIEERIERSLGKPSSDRLVRAIQLLTPIKQPVILMGACLDQSRVMDPAEAEAVCERTEQEAFSLELFATGMRARVLRIEALLRGGQSALAAQTARDMLASAAECQPGDMYWPEVLWIAHQALRQSGDEAAASAALTQAVEWIRQRALPHLPEPLREAFMHRNFTNRAILAAFSRHGD